MAYGALFGPMLGSGNTSYGTMMLFLIIGMTLMGFTFAPMSAVLPELFPTNVRYTGSGISYNVVEHSGRGGGAVHRDVASQRVRRRLGGVVPLHRGVAEFRRDSGHARDQGRVVGYQRAVGRRALTAIHIRR